MWLTHSFRLLRHEIKRGELTIIALAIILAVSAVFSLTGFSSAIQNALEKQSSSFIAADNVLQSSRPISGDFYSLEQLPTIQHAQQMLFGSMVFANDKFQLAEITAVSTGYPLRGDLMLKATAQGDVYSSNQQAPKADHIWVEQKLLSVLGLAVGDQVEIGVAKFTIDALIDFQPDASFSVFTSGPAIIMNIDDVGKTDIIQPGSRLTYKYLFTGEEGELAALSEQIKPKLLDYHRWYDIKTQQSPLSQALVRAERFLSLASMLGIVLAAVAVSVASRRYSQRHQPMVSVFKAIGATQAHITKLYLLHWSSLSLLSILIGLVVGFGLQQLGLMAMADYLPAGDVSTLDVYPFVVAIATGLVCAICFAINPFLQLVAAKPLAVIRGHDQQMSRIATTLGNLPAFVALGGLLYVFSGNSQLTFTILATSSVIIIVLLLMGFAFVSASRKLGAKAGKALHLATANLKRRAKQNSVQLVSFTIAIQLLLLIFVVRNDLIDDWQAQLPVNAPNHFFVNVSAEQVPQLDKFLTANQLVASDIYPVVRGRLAAINSDKLTRRVSKEDEDKSDQGRQGVGRELNLTWRNDVPSNNKILQGSWWGENDQQPQVSIESEIAERLNIAMGDELTFQLGTTEIIATVTSIREVDWQTMQPNFFMILNESSLQQFPATYIASANVTPEARPALQQFLATVPTISIIDVDAMINRLRQVIEQVTLAVEFILGLVILAGMLVLIAQVQASMEEREREIAILRTLGAKGSLLRNSVLFEFIVLGGIAGMLAAISMEAAVAVLQKQMFDMSFTFHWDAWLLGPFAGGIFVGAMGLFTCWRLLRMSSVTLIRRTL